MALEQRKKFNWLLLVSLLWGVLGIVCICPAGVFIAFYDEPIGGTGSGLGMLDYLLIFSIIAFPLVCLGTSLMVAILKNKQQRLAVYAALLPLFSVLCIFAAFAGANLAKCGSLDCQKMSTLQGQGSTTSAASCTPPVFDGGDGLPTTGCGALEFGKNVSGTLKTTAEAQNWQFSSPQTGGRLTISVENDGKSCPQIVILDANGQIVEGFKKENKLHGCLSGMITTSFFYFVPPGTGTYTLRLISPDTTGAYWLKIER